MARSGSGAQNVRWFVIGLSVALMIGLTAAPARADYSGHVEGDSQAVVKLRVEESASGRQERAIFVARHVELRCDDGTTSRRSLGSMGFPARFRFFSANRFSGDRYFLELDPTFEEYWFVEGRVRGDRASGTLLIHTDWTLPAGESHHPDCTTDGVLRWKATR